MSSSMKYYLAKTEPDTYSIGVNNPQAVNFLKQMSPKDLVLVYHTQGQGTIVGLAYEQYH